MLAVLTISMLKTIDSIQSLIDGGYELTAYCETRGCGHRALLPLDKLAAKLGPDHSTAHDVLVPKLRCSKCKGKLSV